MKLNEMSAEAIRRMVHESTVASARLEGSEIPADYGRPAEGQRFLDELLTRADVGDEA